MPNSRPAAAIEPVRPIASSSATLPGPSRRSASKSRRSVTRVDMEPPQLERLHAVPLRPSLQSLPRQACACASELGGDGLRLGVVLQHFLAHLAAPAGLLVAAEG